MSTLQAAHQLRLQQLLDSGRLTPASSPTPESQPPSAVTVAVAPTKTAPRSNKKKRGASKMNLTAVAEATPQYLPDAMNYIVCVSSRSQDVLLENDHSLHCLCSFPTRQAAHDWIGKHRLALARHYLMDPRLSPSELQATAAADGCDDEYYLGEHTSLEIIQVPQYANADKAPDCSVQNLLFNDHFITNRREEDFEAECEKHGHVNEAEDKVLDAVGDTEMAGDKKSPAAATSSPKRATSAAKRRKVHV